MTLAELLEDIIQQHGKPVATGSTTMIVERDGKQNPRPAAIPLPRLYGWEALYPFWKHQDIEEAKS